MTCKNCENNFDDNFKFCPHCGQKANDKLTLGVLFYNTISNYFSFDARFFKSFLPLMTKPGVLAKRFIEGKRLLYLHPAQMYLFVSVVFFFFFSFLSRDYNQKFDDALKKGFNDEIDIENLKQTPNNSEVFEELKHDTVKIPDSLIDDDRLENENTKNTDFSFSYDKTRIDALIKREAPESEIYRAIGMPDDAGFFKRTFYKQVLKFHKQDGKGLLQAFFDSIPISLFILLPLFAFILKLLFYKCGPFSYHLVFSFYYYSFLFTVLSLILVLNFIVDVPDWLDFAIVLSTFVYLWFAIKNFYAKGWFVSFFKTSIVALIYAIIVAPIAIIVMSLGAFLFY